MGCLYKRKQKLPSGEYREMRTWWIKYYQGGRPVRESTGHGQGNGRAADAPHAGRRRRARDSNQPEDGPDHVRGRRGGSAERLQSQRERDARARKATDRPAFETAVQGQAAALHQTTEIRAYVAGRQAVGAANATINRELVALRRMFTLAVQAGKLHGKPHIPMLREDNVRRGFFEAAQFDAVRSHLPEALRPVVTFACLTGWRLKSEVLSIEWRQVDWQRRVVRLDPGTTKNREGRSFPFTADLETLLKQQHVEHEQLKKTGRIVPLVFHRDGERIRDFRKVWETACKAAGCPGRIPHDFRRTAVRNLERAGVPRSAAMAMVGHKTEAIYRRYAIVESGALREAAAKIDAANSLTGTITPKAHSRAKAHSA